MLTQGLTCHRCDCYLVVVSGMLKLTCTGDALGFARPIRCDTALVHYRKTSSFVGGGGGGGGGGDMGFHTM